MDSQLNAKCEREQTKAEVLAEAIKEFGIVARQLDILMGKINPVPEVSEKCLLGKDSFNPSLAEVLGNAPSWIKAETQKCTDLIEQITQSLF